MQSLKDAVDNAIKQHPFHRVSDLSQDEFSDLMVDILKNALKSYEMDHTIATVVSEFTSQ